MVKRVQNNVSAEQSALLNELPYYNFRGDLVAYHGRSNNSLRSVYKTKKNLDSFSDLYDLNLFNRNVELDLNITLILKITYYSSEYNVATILRIILV